MPAQCPYPLVVHRFRPDGPTRPMPSECIEPECEALPGEHPSELPCSWSWQLAHGKVFNGEPFPKRRCPFCAHIRRAGAPELGNASREMGAAG